MIRFILNDKEVMTGLKSGSTLLDFIRYHEHLSGTKIGCREGDCGACTVLEGRLRGERIEYRSIVSCLTPLGNVAGKHIVTVEGLGGNLLHPAQQTMVEHNGSQCGFCTPGFVVSLAGHSMQAGASSEHKAIESISGNICRCTGYKSIERAAISLSRILRDKDPDHPVAWLVGQGYLPPWFVGIPGRLSSIQADAATDQDEALLIGGGTDLMVQQPDHLAEISPRLIFDRDDMKGISQAKGRCTIGAAATASDIMQSTLLRRHIPQLDSFFFLISSEPIRNMGTLGGNIGNASPIADLVIFFLALNSKLDLYNAANEGKRQVRLKEFFLGYKKLDLGPGEIIRQLSFPLPGDDTLVNFEKVSKRNTLDIASVNSAISVTSQQGLIKEAHLASGGLAPIPLYLEKTSAFLRKQKLDAGTIRRAAGVLDQEIAPISDVRGSKEYKRLLARQLFFAHFIKLFPDHFTLKDLV